MKPLFIPGAGMFISAEVAADLRHGALRDLRAAQNDRAYVAPDTVAAVELMDEIGAAWVNKKVSHVAADVSQVDAPRCDPAEWTSMTVSAAVAELKITPQAITGLLRRGALHGERGPRAWRVCAASVTARKEGARCQH